MADKQYTGIDGALYVNGDKVARVQSWQFTGNVDALETTTLGDFARDYINGVQSYSGTANLFYYENASDLIEGAAMFEQVVRTDATPTTPATVLKLQFDNGGVNPRVLEFTCLITSFDISAAAGEIVNASINFNVCGPLTTVSVV